MLEFYAYGNWWLGQRWVQTGYHEPHLPLGWLLIGCLFQNIFGI